MWPCLDNKFHGHRNYVSSYLSFYSPSEKNDPVILKDYFLNRENFCSSTEITEHEVHRPDGDLT